MQELLIVLRNCAVPDPSVGRRVLRPGAVVSATETVAQMLVSRGLAMRAAEPAPLFVDSTTPSVRPKKKGRRHDGGIRDGTHDAS
jgi:hypothetical protein